jgi:hypothetical protein
MMISSFPRGQHYAAARALQMHDHAGVVFRPQIAAARRAETGLASALRVSARKVANARELIDGAGSADFLNAATGARNRADKLEWVGTPLVFQGTAAAAQAGNEVLGDRHAARGRHACMLCAVGVLKPEQPVIANRPAMRVALSGGTAR